jgi:hypothetical protein
MRDLNRTLQNYLQDTKLDVLNILANVAASKNAVAEVV